MENAGENPPHESYARLMEAAAELGIHTAKDLAARLGMNPSRVGNWRSRKVAGNTAIQIEMMLGISRSWIELGREPRFVPALVDKYRPGDSPTPPAVMLARPSPEPLVLSATEILDVLRMMGSVSPDRARAMLSPSTIRAVKGLGLSVDALEVALRYQTAPDHIKAQVMEMLSPPPPTNQPAERHHNETITCP